MAFKFFRFFFGENGDTSPVPDAVQAGGEVSYEEGFSDDYEKELGVDPEARAMPRAQYNQLMQDVTGNLRDWQEFLYPQWVTAAENGGVQLPYLLGTRVRHNGVRYVAVVNNTEEEPGTGTEWILEDRLRLDLPNRLVITAVQDFTPPAGLDIIKVTLCGAGGGGGGASTRAGGGGGGAGEVKTVYYTGADIQTTYWAAPGAGGLGGAGDEAGTGDDGTDGVSTTLSVGPGSGAIIAQASFGRGGDGTSVYGRGGLGGSNGFVNGDEFDEKSDPGNSGVSGAADRLGNASGGAGAGTVFGGGGYGGTALGEARDAYGFGSGGGGGGSGSGEDGADGAQGMIIFEW